MASEYDLIVLGSGNAGLAVAGVAKAAGQSVLVAESRDVGGTCPLRGCVPKKVLVAAAECLEQIRLAPQHHISVGPATLDWPMLIGRKQGFVEGVPKMFEDSLTGRGIDVAHGHGRFTGQHAIAVDGESYNAGKMVIATGSKPCVLPIPGFEHAIISDDILELEALPESVAFIGAGVIALEFAHVFARAGAKVTLLEVMDRPLPALDEDVVAALTEATRALGIDVFTAAQTSVIDKVGAGFDVRFTHEGREKTLTVASVVNGAGRVSAVDDLDLEAAGIAADGARIEVDEFLRSTTNADVFVAGDTLQTAQLSALASYEGRIVGHNLVHEDMISPDYSAIPSAVFTVPALASVGLTEAEAMAQGLKFEAKCNDLCEWRSARTYAEPTAFAKVLIEDGTSRILGAQLLGHGAGEIVHLFAFAMQHGVTASEIAAKTYAYPTFASDIKNLV